MAGSLGTLSIDLIARTGGFTRNLKGAESEMERFARRARRDFRKVADDARQLGRTFARLGTVVGGAATALGYFASQQAQAVQRTNAMAQATGVATGEFQQLQYAITMVGGQADDALGLVKDLQERIGEAAMSQSGEGYEVLQQIGLDAEKLQKLSIVDQLTRIGEAIKGLPKAQQVYILESLASESSALLPLLREGATELRRFAGEAVEMNTALSAFETNRITDAARSFDQMGASITGVINALIVELAPTIQSFAKAFTRATQAVVENMDRIIRVVEVAATLIGARLTAAVVNVGWSAFALAARSAAAAVRSAGVAASTAAVAIRGLKGALALLGGPAGVLLLAASAAYQWISSSNDVRSEVNEQANKIDTLARKWGELTKAQRQNAIFQQQEVVTKLQEQVSQQAQEMEKVAMSRRLVTDATTNQATSQKLANDYDRQAIENQSKLADISQRLYKERKRLQQLKSGDIDMADFGGGPPKPTPTTPTGGTASGTSVQRVEVPKRPEIYSMSDRARDALDQFNQGNRTVESVKAKYDKLAEYARLYYNDAGKKAEVLARIQSERAKAVAQMTGEQYNRMSEFAQQAARNVQDTLGRTLKQTLAGNFDGILESWSNMLLEMAAQAQAAQLNRALLGDSFASDGKLGGLLGAAGKSLGGMFGSMFGPSSASIGTSFADAGIGGIGTGVQSQFGGFFAKGGNPPIGKGSIVGENGPELIVPRTPTTVIPNHAIPQGGSNSGPVVNQYVTYNEAEGKTGEERQRDQQSLAKTLENQITSVVVSDMAQRGPMSRSFQNIFNLKRKGAA
ncbi:hypothetical protein SAOR_00935 [Salinisphaera orenii MK-B5]|uniref:Uncharacterized protein n=1 Tax=Salinisphaera orenii MK-B5 TaxID=856730 RepID=A0A423PYJ0_9GAMM|nr:hypothetical protein [Salinisphaera orenii]ROO30593.1 hypothetical protein SAOR_00935 [Salinisphaera orenii MK-B5]